MELLGPEIFWSRRQRGVTSDGHTEQRQTKICNDSAQFATQIYGRNLLKMYGC